MGVFVPNFPNLPKTLQNSYLKSLHQPDNTVLSACCIALINAAEVGGSVSQAKFCFGEIETE
jgi:hypothetical protein